MPFVHVSAEFVVDVVVGQEVVTVDNELNVAFEAAFELNKTPLPDVSWLRWPPISGLVEVATSQLPTALFAF